MRGPRMWKPILVALIAWGCAHAPAPCPAPPVLSATSPAEAPSAHVRWLLDHSMLAQSDRLARTRSGTGGMWQHPYGSAQPRAAAAMASVWFTAYPASTLTAEGASVLQTLGDPKLWEAFDAIGIQGMHTGPMKLAGGIRGQTFTPTVDGNFDRIASTLDPTFGDQADYRHLVETARAHHGAIIGDIIPGHSGKGADFRLAELGWAEYPGLYHMVQINRADWGLLPEVPAGKDTVNLKPPAVDALQARGYIVGQLPRTLFYEPGVKESDWSATPLVRGEDGVERRWVYLHYFKEGQPTFNWLDPTFAAPRLVVGDAINSLDILGERMLRLDANGFLGIEVGAAGGRAFSEGHPLSVTANQLIAGMVRKLGGYTFQELNLTLEDLRKMSQGGADLSYDFVTRPACQHALVTGDAEFLRLMLGLERQYHLDPAAMIHALQNHDELTLELVHFWFVHAKDPFRFRGRERTGTELRELIRKEMQDRLLAPRAPYNLKASNGVSLTNATLAAAALGMTDVSHPTPAQADAIRQAHLLLAAFNALQPGVFALSGWDLVGALTLPAESVKPLLADGDTRWINRGAYDLLGVNPKAEASRSGLPRAQTLYGPLPAQLAKPDSFASRLKAMLAVRTALRLYEAEVRDLPKVKSPGLVVMVHQLPGGMGLELTALNFGTAALDEQVTITDARPGATVADALENGAGKTERVGAQRQVRIQLASHGFRALVVR